MKPVQVYSGNGVDYDKAFNRLPEHLQVALARMKESQWHVDSYEEFEYGDVEGIRLKNVQETNQIAELRQAIGLLEDLGESTRPVMDLILHEDEQATQFRNRRIIKVSRLGEGTAMPLSTPITVEIEWKYVSK